MILNTEVKKNTSFLNLFIGDSSSEIRSSYELVEITQISVLECRVGCVEICLFISTINNYII